MHTQNRIIGFGKAGKTLAADLANNGQSVVLVEQNDQMYGGTCINIGCIPSKKLLVEGAKQHDFQAAAAIKAGAGDLPEFAAEAGARYQQDNHRQRDNHAEQALQQPHRAGIQFDLPFLHGENQYKKGKNGFQAA